MIIFSICSVHCKQLVVSINLHYNLKNFVEGKKTKESSNARKLVKKQMSSIFRSTSAKKRDLPNTIVLRADPSKSNAQHGNSFEDS